jgi:hypothetical protein
VAWRGVGWRLLEGMVNMKCKSPSSERQTTIRCILLPKGRGQFRRPHVLSHVELSWKTPRQRATLWAIIMPPPNEALADPSLPLYSALSLSLPLSSLALSSSLLYGSFIRLFTSPFCLLAWDPNFIPRYHIWATHLLSTKTHLLPPLDHLLATGGRNYHPQSTPTRTYSVCQLCSVFRSRQSR